MVKKNQLVLILAMVMLAGIFCKNIYAQKPSSGLLGLTLHYEDRIKELTDRLLATEKAFAELKLKFDTEIPQNRKEIKKKDARLRHMELDFLQAQSDNDKYEKIIDEMQDDARKRLRALDGLTRKLNKYKGEFSGKSGDLTRKEKQYKKNAEKQQRQINKLKETADSETKRFTALLLEREKEIDRLKTKIKESQRGAKAITGDVEKLKLAQSKKDQAIEKLEKDMKSKLKDISGLEDNEKVLEAKIVALAKEYEDYKKSKEPEMQRLLKANSGMADLNDQLDTVKADLKNSRMLQKDYEKEIRTLTENLMNKEQRLDFKDKELLDCKKKLEEFESTSKGLRKVISDGSNTRSGLERKIIELNKTLEYSKKELVESKKGISGQQKTAQKEILKLKKDLKAKQSELSAIKTGKDKVALQLETLKKQNEILKEEKTLKDQTISDLDAQLNIAVEDIELETKALGEENKLLKKNKKDYEEKIKVSKAKIKEIENRNDELEKMFIAVSDEREKILKELKGLNK